jgi:hypothetical protein
MLKQKDKIPCGILLLAIGHPYYGRMAYNLAMSIKAKDSSVHITLVYTEGSISHINERNLHLFDNKLAIDATNQPFGAKLLLDQLTPYDRTLYMDVDTLWVNKCSPAKLFDELNGIAFTGITEGMHDYSDPNKSDANKQYPTWADLDEIKSVFQLQNSIIYQWRSEFMYFEGQGQDVFEYARVAYARAQELTTVKKFADHIPDELAINIAVNQCGMWPHEYKWKPTYWDRLYGGNMTDIADLQANYYAISCGSNYNGAALKRTYDRICAASAARLNLQHVFPLVNKKEMMTNRQLM